MSAATWLVLRYPDFGNFAGKAIELRRFKGAADAEKFVNAEIAAGKGMRWHYGIVKVNAAQTNNTQSASSTSSDSSLQSIESTFLTLLVQELQNQDPTAPMDSTQMVGQMISLNQLDQLASINQVVTNALGTSPTAAFCTMSAQVRVVF